MITGASIVAFFEGMLYLIAGAYVDFDQNLISILFLFVLLDTITGLFKVIKVCATFYTIRQIALGFCAKISILIVPLLVALLLKALDYNEGIELGLNIVLRLFILSEFISILRNILILVSGKIIKEVDLVSYVINYIINRSLNFACRFMDIKIDVPDLEPIYKQTCPDQERRKAEAKAKASAFPLEEQKDPTDEDRTEEPEEKPEGV